MNFHEVGTIAAELTALKFFPSDDDGRLAIVKLIGSMASNEDQVRWLVNRMLVLFDEWPGPRTLRAVFCKKYKPREGEDLRCISTDRYPDGIPDEKRIEATPRGALPAGRQFTADAALEEKVQSVFYGMPQMPRLLHRTPQTAAERRFEQRLLEVATPPCDRETLPEPSFAAAPSETPPVGIDGRFVGVVAPPRRITEEDIERAVREYRQKKANRQS